MGYFPWYKSIFWFSSYSYHICSYLNVKIPVHKIANIITFLANPPNFSYHLPMNILIKSIIFHHFLSFPMIFPWFSSFSEALPTVSPRNLLRPSSSAALAAALPAAAATAQGVRPVEHWRTWGSPKMDGLWLKNLWFIEGSLEVKLPTIWIDGKTEVGSVREEKPRSEKIREKKKWEERRCRCAKR